MMIHKHTLAFLLISSLTWLPLIAMSGPNLIHALKYGQWEEKFTGNDPFYPYDYPGKDNVELLKKSDLNATDDKGNTPLHLAALRNTHWCTKALLTAGADPKARNNEGETPFHVAAKYGLIENLLALHDVSDINAGDMEGITPLQHAVTNGEVLAIKFLLLAKADPNAITTSSRATPLHFAIPVLRTECVLALLRGGAHVLPDKNGRTPLDGVKDYKKTLRILGAVNIDGECWKQDAQTITAALEEQLALQEQQAAQGRDNKKRKADDA